MHRRWLLPFAWLLGACLAPAAGSSLTAGRIKDVPISLPNLDEPLSCSSDSPAALSRCVEPARLQEDVQIVAHARPPGSDHHRSVQMLCEQRLRSLGYDVSQQRYSSTGLNVIAEKPGFSKPHEQVIVGAHYDQRPGCSGADDNASGVAAVLELARVLAGASLDRTLVIACWDEGETGQLGSRAHVRRARAAGAEVTLAVAFDSVGHASSKPDSQRIPERFEEIFPDHVLELVHHELRADFLLVVADGATRRYAGAVVRHGEQLALPVYVLELTARHKAELRPQHRSDNASFWEASYRALLLTDTGRWRSSTHGCQAGDDLPDSLDLTFLTKVTGAGLGAVAEALIVR